MLKTKLISGSALLRVIAVVAIISFSFEITSSFLVVDEMQIEIVDTDFEDDVEYDDEFDSTWNHLSMEVSEIAKASSLKGQLSPQQLKSEHLQELPTPPPDFM